MVGGSIYANMQDYGQKDVLFGGKTQEEKAADNRNIADAIAQRATCEK